MKTKSVLLTAAAIAVALLANSFKAYAQMDERAPGIYAVIDGESTPLTYTNGGTSTSSTNVLGVEIGKRKQTYKGETSGVQATDTFVLVINPEKKAITKTLKTYDPFIKTLTPDDLIIVPLEVQKNKRVYNEGVSLQGFNLDSKGRVPFEWEQISDNSFIITAAMLPGEYGIVFKPARLGEYDFNSIFGFFVAEK